MTLITIILLLLDGVHQKIHFKLLLPGVRHYVGTGIWDQQHLLCFPIQLTAHEAFSSQRPHLQGLPTQHLPPMGNKKRVQWDGAPQLKCFAPDAHRFDLWSNATFLKKPTSLPHQNQILAAIILYSLPCLHGLHSSYYCLTLLYYLSPILENNFPRERGVCLITHSVHCA